MLPRQPPVPRNVGSIFEFSDAVDPLPQGKPTAGQEAEFKGLLVDMALLLHLREAGGAALQAVLDPVLKDHAVSSGTAAELIGAADANVDPTLTVRPHLQRCLARRDVKLPFGKLGDLPPARTVCGLHAAFDAELLAAVGRDIRKAESTIKLLEKLRAGGCQLAVLYHGYSGKQLLRSVGLDSLFHLVMDATVVERFDLRSAPEPDIVLKCCTALGLSPYECVLLCPYGARGCAAGAKANLGLVLGCIDPTLTLDPTMQEQELYKEGADLVVDPQQLTPASIAQMYARHITEDVWHLAYRAFLPSDEPLREAITSLGNGYHGSRACWEGARRSEHHYPGVYLAPVYNTAPSEVMGRTVYNSDMVNLPNWALVEVSVGDGGWVSPFDPGMRIVGYSHALRLKSGALQRRITFQDPQGRTTTIETARIISMHAYHTCAVQYTVIPENYSAPLRIRSSLDGDVINANVPRYNDLTQEHLTDFAPSHEAEDNAILLYCRTIHTNVGVVLFAKHTFWVDSRESATASTAVIEAKAVGAEFAVEAQQGKPYTLEKVVSIFSSVDAEFKKAPDNDAMQLCLSRLAREELQNIKYFAQLFEPHKRAWAELWDKSDMCVEGDRFVQLMIRAHTFQLLATASPNRALVDAGLPARGLAGEGYRGHVFWDEVYMFPFYLSKCPEVCKAHLQYRCRRLPEARAYAAEAGYKGAMYPWQTSDSGREETQVVHYNPVSGQWDPDTSCRQRHVSIAIFLDAWRYWQETQDREFLEGGLAEMMLDIAVFWCSITTFDESDGKYHIMGVMGPDEYHEHSNVCGVGVKDNAYTNVLVLWVTQKAQELLTILTPETAARLRTQLGITDEMMAKMTAMQTKMCVIVVNGILQQFDGYAALKELDWPLYRQKHRSVKRIDRILKAEGLTPDDYKVAKQPDTLMLYYLLPMGEITALLTGLGVEIEDEVAFLRANYDYYVARTSHGSTLSFTVMAKIAQLCGRADLEWDWFMGAAKSDLYDSQGTTGEGIHCAVMAGTLDIIVSNFAGLREHVDGSYHIRPSLPKAWQALSFKRLLRGQWYEFTITKKDVKITLADSLSDEPSRPFYIGNNKIIVCPWSPITVEYAALITVRNLYDLMRRTKFVRQSLVAAWGEGTEPDPRSVGVLRHALQSLETAPSGDGGRAQLVLDGRRRVMVELEAEQAGLQKDLAFLMSEEKAFCMYLGSLAGNPDFETHVEAGVKFLENIRFHTFITDRDGTINMHCGRYGTSVQPVYAAVFLQAFATRCAQHSLILTSAPLHALRDVSVLPDNLFALGCSKGQEVLSKQGLYHCREVPEEGRALLRVFTHRLRELLRQPGFEKFGLVGSGLQVKPTQTTVARSDPTNSIAEDEANAFVERVQRLAAQVGGERLAVTVAACDIEITPTDVKAGLWTKGDGLEWADRWLGLGLGEGPVLVCGDALSDLPMLETAMRYNAAHTRAIFVTSEAKLMDAVRAVCPTCLFVPSPDTLLTILYNTAQRCEPPAE